VTADDAERALAELGAELAERVAGAVPAWVIRSVEAIFDAWTAAGSPGAPDDVASDSSARADARTAVLAAADVTARRAGEEVGARLRELLLADMDAQRATPLEVVRAAVVYPRAVLRGAGVPPIERDRFATDRFPDDDYGLTPPSLAALDPSLADLAVRWGAAKAAGHRQRHG
jgi:hypothetical protein